MDNSFMTHGDQDACAADQSQTCVCSRSIMHHQLVCACMQPVTNT